MYVLAPLPLAYDTRSFAEALNGVLMEYGICQEDVTAVTTDTLAKQKTAVLDHTGMEWLPCISSAMELVMDILIKHFAEVRGLVVGRVVSTNGRTSLLSYDTVGQ